WAPHPDEGDKILYIFDCGELGQDEAHIHLDGDELDRWAWVELDKLPDHVIPRLARRLGHACQARASGQSAYLENGVLATDPDGMHRQAAAGITDRAHCRICPS